MKDGVVTATQDRPGNGGILLTDKRYRDFEVSLEVNPDWGCDGGLFLRSNEEGDAYQVMIDYLEGGSVGGIYGEGLSGVTTQARRRSTRSTGRRASGTCCAPASRATRPTSRCG